MRTAMVSETLSPAELRVRRLREAMGVRSEGQLLPAPSAGSTPKPAGDCSPQESQTTCKIGSSVVDGFRLAWERTSQGDRNSQPIVCLHNVGSGSREFRPLLHRTPPGSHILAFDWPGHGRSESLSALTGGRLTVERAAGLLGKLLLKLHIVNPVLLGTGFGAAVALYFASACPKDVLALVLCQPEGLIEPESKSPAKPQSRDRISRLIGRMGIFTQPQTRFAAPIAAQKQALRTLALLPAMQSKLALARRSMAAISPQLLSALQTLACPAMLALSRHNREFPLAKYLDLLDPSLAWVPQHRFTVFSGSFHPIWDEPDRFAQTVNSFLQAQLPLAVHTHAWILAAVDYPTGNTNLWKCIHPDCGRERVLPSGQNANALPLL